MATQKTVKCKCCKKRIPPNPNLSKTERERLYTQFTANGMGAKLIHRRTGIPLGTVKTDLAEIRKRGREFQPPTPPASKPKKHKDASPPSSPEPEQEGEQFDYSGALDRFAQYTVGVFARAAKGSYKCKECGAENQLYIPNKEALTLMEKYIRIYQAKHSGKRKDRGDQNGGERMPAEVEIRDVIECLKRHDGGPNCLMCGQPKPDRVIVIDAEVKEHESD